MQAATQALQLLQSLQHQTRRLETATLAARQMRQRAAVKTLDLHSATVKMRADKKMYLSKMRLTLRRMQESMVSFSTFSLQYPPDCVL